MLALSSLFVGAQAQSLSGRVVAVESGEGVPYAGVVLQSVADSASLARVLCDKQGNFEFADSLLTGLSEGRLVVEALSYNHGVFSTQIPQRNQILKITNAVGHTLGTAEVTARRYQADQMGYTYNLKGDKKVKGLSALQAMNMVPGLSLDLQGNILLNGVNIKTIYLNGRPLKGVEELKSIPAEYLAKAKVEYVDQTRSEKMGSALNLTLDVPKGGFYGSLSSKTQFRKNQYDTPNEDLSGMFYYQRNRLSLYTNVMYSVNGNRTGNFNDNIYDDGTGMYSREKDKGWNNYGSAVVSMNYNFTQKDLLSLYYTYNGSKYHINTTADYSFTNQPALQPYTELTRNRDGMSQHAASLLYVHFIDNKGSNFNFTADYNGTTQTLDRDISRNDRTEGLKLGSEAGTDLFQAAARWNYRVTNWFRGNVSALFTQYNTSYTPLNSPTGNDYYSNYGYHTTTHSSKPLVSATFVGGNKVWDYYVIAQYFYTRTSYKVPVRNVHLKFEQHAVDVMTQLGYKFDENGKNRVILSYSHRNGALPFEQMDSTRHWNGSYYYSVGNPELRGSKEESVDLNFSFLYGKLYARFKWAYMHDGIEYITAPDPTLPGVLMSKPVNGLKSMDYIIDVGANFQPFKWWHINLNVRCARSKNWMDWKNAPATVYANYAHGSWDNRFMLPSNWYINIGFSADTSIRSLYTKYKGVHNLFVSVDKQLLQDNLTLSLSCTSGKTRSSYTYFDGGYRKWQNRLFLPALKFNVVWRFNGGRKNISTQVMQPGLTNNKLPSPN